MLLSEIVGYFFSTCFFIFGAGTSFARLLGFYMYIIHGTEFSRSTRVLLLCKISLKWARGAWGEF